MDEEKRIDRVRKRGERKGEDSLGNAKWISICPTKL